MTEITMLIDTFKRHENERQETIKTLSKQRENEMKALHRQGLTWIVIGEIFGVSGETARQAVLFGKRYKYNE